jgi:hypothetical protein
MNCLPIWKWQKLTLVTALMAVNKLMIELSPYFGQSVFCPNRLLAVTAGKRLLHSHLCLHSPHQWSVYAGPLKKGLHGRTACSWGCSDKFASGKISTSSKTYWLIIRTACSAQILRTNRISTLWTQAGRTLLACCIRAACKEPTPVSQQSVESACFCTANAQTLSGTG